MAKEILPVSSDMITAMESVSSVIPIPALCLVPKCGGRWGLDERGNRHEAAAILPFEIITAPSCRAVLGSKMFTIRSNETLASNVIPVSMY